MKQEQGQKPVQIQPQRKKRSWIKRSLLVLLLLCITFFILIQIPAVQQWILTKVLEDIEQRTDTEITVEGFSLRFINKLHVKGICIETIKRGDTILMLDESTLSFKNPIWTYLTKQKFIIQSVAVDGVHIHNVKTLHEEQSDLSLFFKAFDGAKKESSGTNSAIAFDVNDIALKDCSYIAIDSLIGKAQIFSLDKANIQPSYLGFSSDSIILQEAIVDGFSVAIQEFKPATGYEPKNQDIEQASSALDFLLFIERLEVNHSTFQLDHYRKSPVRMTASNEIDWQHFAVRNITIEAHEFQLSNWVFQGKLDNLSGQMDSGFSLSRIAANSVYVDTTKTQLKDARIKTPSTDWTGDIRLSYEEYPSFKEFVDRVYLQVHGKEGSVAISDIICFAPKLKEIPFFSDNANQNVIFSGYVNGVVNGLQGEQLYLNLANQAEVRGSFSSQYFADERPIELELNIQKANSSMSALRKVLPQMRVPDQFNRLGTLVFTGSFNGRFDDFVAIGDLQTDLGYSKMNMELRVPADDSIPIYRGKLDLVDFNLREWTASSDFGTVTVNAIVENGRGLRLENLESDIEAEVESFTYKDYVYKDVFMDGTFDQKVFNGLFSIHDPNIDLTLDGSINFAPAIPLINASADVVSVNLMDLNLSTRNLNVAGHGDVNIRNYNISDLEGEIDMENIRIIEDDTIKYSLAFLNAKANVSEEDEKNLTVRSEIGSLNVFGRYDWKELWPKLKSDLYTYYPTFYEYSSWQIPSDTLADQIFQAKVNITNSKNWSEFFLPGLAPLEDSDFSLSWNDKKGNFYLTFYSPFIRYNNLSSEDAYVDLYTTKELSNLQVGSQSFTIDETITFEAPTIFADVVQDTLLWTINAADFRQRIDEFNFEGSLYVGDDKLNIHFLNETISLFSDAWDLHPKNLIQIDSAFLHVDQWRATNNDRHIEFKSINNKGLACSLDSLDLSLLNDIWAYDKLSFDGIVSAEVEIANVFARSAISGELLIDSLEVNEDDYGQLQLLANAPDQSGIIRVEGGINHPDHWIQAKGYLFTAKNRDRRDYYDIAVDMNHYPLHILEYFLNGNIQNTKGQLTGQFTLTGPQSQPKLDGQALLTNGDVTIPFLGARVFIDSQVVRSMENRIDVSGATIQDIYNNTMTIQGGLTHDYFRDLGLDVEMTTDEFLLLHTEDDDTSIYYGHCVSAANIEMTGLIATPTISINAYNTKDTRFYLRTDVSENNVNAGFFRFEDLRDTISLRQRKTYTTPKGVNFSLDLTANENAAVEIIIDKQTGDIIRGRGNGNIQFNLDRSGDISMYGDYTISEGEYLFTSQVFINKTFGVAPGSTIEWTGDPFGAILDIKAEYQVFTSPYFFVQELVTDPALADEFRNNTQVFLIVNLTGLLYAPELSFDFRFPQLTGQAKSIVDNKLDLLQSNPSEMYEQAGAIIVLNSFAPPSNSTGQRLGFAAGVNTLSEFVTNQFSTLLSNIVRSAVQDVEFIDDVNIDVDYYLNTDELLQQGQNNTLNNGEFRFSTQTKLFNRVELDLGGNYGVNNNALGANANGTYFNGNFAIEYAITRRRQLILRVYSITDQVLEGRRTRSGVGLRFEREFTTFEEFFSGLQRAVSSGPPN